MLYRAFVRVVDLLPEPARRVQVAVAVAVLISQAGIAVTGAVVRVTASGLGCPTWPQCFPGSFTPEAHAEVAGVHQAVEFGNRILSFLVVVTAALIVIAVTRARRRREVRFYAWLMPASTVVQAVVGGITVLTGLLWWTVAIHLLLSMAMVWLSVMLLEKVREPDTGVVAGSDAVAQVPAPLRWLTVLSAVVMAGVLVAGTMVTGAGPHAGDTSPQNPVPRLRVQIVTLVHLHADLLIAYLALLVALGFALVAVGAPVRVRRRLYVVVATVVVQALIGVTQYALNVPEALVVLHVAGAGASVAATAALWISLRPRAVPEPTPRVTADRAVTPSV
ncbi:COX15/CtaA family protein [Williamsia sterculiae]|uniref:Cytochrome c oxidase assembly protein subunit 15 n=1 Tax=Williamsia sterculiae TaxID=1344003 RepID=A0A1N7EJT5_9NOCA|nr:COX15/CtaA family protein [Williamsia sterculiae]SIR88225.1 cytochrome c oxidase assembly protein subunit 15 [Williamsia sterculiae]